MKKFCNWILKIQILASIVNDQGVFQIEDHVFKITNKHTYVFKNREAYNSFSFPKNKSTNPTTSYIAPCDDREVAQLEEEVYRIENCGGTGGGGTDPGDGDNDTDSDDLDPNDNIDIDYAASRTAEYESGGTTGRLRGESWNQNFWVFSSVGTKSVHERHTWGKWWDRTAEEITLESFIRYSYGEKIINPTQLTQSLKVKLSDITNLIPGGVDYYIQRALNLAVGDQLSEKVWHAAKDVEFTILTAMFK